MNSLNRLPRWIFTFAKHDEDTAEEPEAENVEVPEDLSAIPDEQLAVMETDLLATFDAIRSEAIGPDELEELRQITAAINRVRLEGDKRAVEAAAVAEEVAALASEVRPVGEEPAEEPAPEEEPEPEPEPEPVPAEPVQAQAAAPAAPAVASTIVPARSTTPGSLVFKKRGINVPLSEVRRRAPDPELNPRTEAMVITAPDVPSYVAGRALENLDVLTDAMHRRAKTLATPSGMITVATIRREFDITLDREAAPESIWDIMHRASDPEHLVAAGGWCAPSTIIYDFFNIACDDGILDVPTIGVTRGGIRFPVSPSIADTLDDIWLWTEGDDIAAATGAGTKPCVRVPCPSFSEERLDCHGLCITAGNLTESAYPELIRNYLSLVMNAHRHVINQRIIADIVANSTAVTVTGTDQPITTGILGAIGLQVADYRERFRMCDNDPLEVVLPRWSKQAIKSDVAKRNGVDMLAVSDAEMMSWFNERQVRVQFVSDWQVGSGDFPGQSTARVAWPATVQFLIYAAGTWVVGNGLDLDLGVVRDSTLNAKNDHTAAWTEECKLVAKIGHDSRLVTIDFCVNGATGPNILPCSIV